MTVQAQPRRGAWLASAWAAVRRFVTGIVVIHPGEGVNCPRCQVGYHPMLTRWACPVCDTDAPNAPAAAVERAWSDPDVRVVSIVIAATALNLIVLAVLTAVALHS